MARAWCSVSPTIHSPSAESTATSASLGARSSAKPPSPKATAGDTRWTLCPSISARLAAASRSRSPDRGGSLRCCHVSTIVCQPVHRHRWADNARCTSSSVASGFLFSSPARRTTMPGVQKPHWLPPVAQKASPQRWRAALGSPSSVVIARPRIRRVGVTQATRGWSSTRTVQQPHWPWGLQPSLAERLPR